MTYFKKDIPGLTTPCHFPTSYKHDIVLIPNQDAFLSVLEDSAAISSANSQLCMLSLLELALSPEIVMAS